MPRTIAARPAPRLRASAAGAALGAARERMGSGFGAIGGRPRLRLALICALVALPLLAGGFMWLRSSPLVAVKKVTVAGASGPEAGAIRSALEEAGRGMSTLNIDEARLQAAVAPFRIVSQVHAYPSFPHSLRLVVVEQLPVAALTADGQRTAVAADGVVLGPALLSPSLPALASPTIPPVGGRIAPGQALAALSVLGAAPGGLGRFVAGVSEGPRGLTLTMRDGLLVYFGDATLPHAKWLSLVRVLADPSSHGASYVDVRLPSRPAAGFPGGVAPEGTPAAAAAATAPGGAATTTTPGQSSEATIAQLAAGLQAGGGGGAPAAAEPEAKEANPGESQEAGAGGGSSEKEAEPSG